MSTVFAVDYYTPVRPLTGKAKHAAWAVNTPTEQIRAASFAYWRQAGKTASEAIDLMRTDVVSKTTRFPAHYPDANPDFAAYGESRLRWIEKPEALGLRLVGLAHEVAPANYAYLRNAVEHTGWFTDPDQYDIVCGVVYQTSATAGCPRYLAGYADPWNTDKAGRGPALLSMAPIIGEHVDTAWEFDPVLRDAARRADGIAESTAKNERDHQEAYRAGHRARNAGQSMRSAAAEYVGALRALRVLLRRRRDLLATDARRILGPLVAHVRSAEQQLTDAHRAFHSLLATETDYHYEHSEDWRDGYLES
ncbi:hypothetical protein [uncultured Ruegeria sp.]|uniref:hypothetical protein n=1 Tax=uncultured Ruegeria sp. TaxID=259304 RepID=UPI0026094291|nr:hypothetical protein [uncultured Ruegeria sp.]